MVQHASRTIVETCADARWEQARADSPRHSPIHQVLFHACGGNARRRRTRGSCARAAETAFPRGSARSI
eukprot:1373224-Pyramimonas_sp.AAC.1